MSGWRRAAAALAVLLGASIPAAAQNVAGLDLGALAARSRGPAGAAIATFAALVTPANAGRMGFADAGAVARAELGVPFCDFVLDLPRLAAFRAGTDPVTLLRPTGMIHWPLRPAGGGHSSVTLAARAGGWEAVSFGSPARTRAIVTARDEAARREEVPAGEFFLLRVPAWNVLFVARLAAGELRLTPAADAPWRGLAGGRTEPAAAIFARLADAAARDPGGLR